MIGVLTLQTQTLILFYPHTQNSISRWIGPPKLRPFVDYRMYQNANCEGDIISDLRIMAVGQDSWEVEIVSSDLDFRKWPVLPLIRLLFVWDVPKQYFSRE